MSVEETCLASTRAGVYTKAEGKWVPLESIASVWVMQNEETKFTRVVASNDNNEFFLNTNITATIRYKKASEVFMQWQDPLDSSFVGLNFPSADTLSVFAAVIDEVVVSLGGSSSEAPLPVIPVVATASSSSEPVASVTEAEGVTAQVSSGVRMVDDDEEREVGSNSGSSGDKKERGSERGRGSSAGKKPKEGDSGSSIDASHYATSPNPSSTRTSSHGSNHGSNHNSSSHASNHGSNRGSSSGKKRKDSPKLSRRKSASIPGMKRRLSKKENKHSVSKLSESASSSSKVSTVTIPPLSASAGSASSKRSSVESASNSARDSPGRAGSGSWAHNSDVKSPITTPRSPSGRARAFSGTHRSPSIQRRIPPPPVGVKPASVEEDLPQEEVEKRLRLRTNYTNEIYSTEVTYVSNLQTATKIWQAELLNKKLPAEDSRKIFSNMDVILDFNHKLVVELGSRLDNFDAKTTKIGDVFVSLAPYLRLYKQYCDNYENALATLDRVSKKKEFAKVLKSCEARCNGFSLAFYLIMPVQRIPRYNLLLRDLIKQTSPSHPDYENIQEALKHIGSVADDVNKSVLKAEKARAMAGLLDRGFLGLDDLMAPHRHLVLDGPLQSSFQSVECTWVLLFNDIIAFASPADKKEKGKVLKRTIQGYLKFDAAWAKPVPEVGEDAVELKTPEASVLLRTSPLALKKGEQVPVAARAKWCDEIQKSIHDWLLRPTGLDDESREKNEQMMKGQLSEDRYMRYQFKDTTVYEGEWKNAKFSGKGKLTSPNGAVFEGNFLRGGLQGFATARWRDGATYTGNWQLDMPSGQGTLVDSRGNTYTGEWAIGRKKGTGKMAWVNGDRYDGEWLNDRYHGVGTYIHFEEPEMVDMNSFLVTKKVKPEGEETRTPSHTYKGDWEEGLRHGHGEFVAKGYRYVGGWKNNVQNGEGEETASDGHYKGHFVSGKRDGMGTFTSKSGNITYTGEWSGTYHGKGRLEKKACSFSYEGEFVSGLAHGHGKEVSGLVTYEGDFKMGVKDGPGTLTDDDGSVYEGKFLQGQRSGEGKMTYVDGSVYSGLWNNGQREGRGTCTWADGSKYVGAWKFDVPHGFGVMTHLDGSTYQGDYRMGVHHGHGILTNEYGEYSGNWVSGKRDGSNSDYSDLTERTFFTGDYKAGMRNGPGTLYKGTDELDRTKEHVSMTYSDGVLKQPGIKYFAPSLPETLWGGWNVRF